MFDRSAPFAVAVGISGTTIVLLVMGAVLTAPGGVLHDTQAQHLAASMGLTRSLLSVAVLGAMGVRCC